MHEFDIIQQFFTKAYPRKDIILGIGDDAALVSVPPLHELVITTDTLVADVHFFKDALAKDIGYKSLAVNLSDLAAMGAAPQWMTLALTLPAIHPAWLNEFSQGFFELAQRFDIALIGGDLTQGPLALTIQALGLVPQGKALRRSGAKPHDLIYVSGTLGDAKLALAYLQQAISLEQLAATTVLPHLHRPQPRIELGQKLRGLASAAIDISDGLAQDLSHLLKASGVGAAINVDALPLSATLKKALSPTLAQEFALQGGDDYELCFTVPQAKQALLEKSLLRLDCGYTCIGTITAEPTLQLHYQDGRNYHGALSGYQHF